MVTDPISDMMIRLKNAGMTGNREASVPYSEFKNQIAELLKREGYLKVITKRGKKVKKFLELELAYEGEEPRIHEVRRISKPSRRVYHQVGDIRPVRQGHGLAVYSTSRGLKTDREARTEKLGGEILFTLW